MNHSLIRDDTVIRQNQYQLYKNASYKNILCVFCIISIVCSLYLLFFIHLLYETLDLSNVTIYD